MDIKKYKKDLNNDVINNPIKHDIAIIGISCRFPGAKDYQAFWDNLIKGVDSIREIDRWDFENHYSPYINDNKSISKWMGMLNDVDQFDNTFFNISPREAMHMDPQQRILLEETWHCIEDSGIELKKLKEKRTSVYVAAVAAEPYIDYSSDSSIDIYSGLGMYQFMLSNRVSFFFGLNGESKIIESACASSLVALYDAQKSFVNKGNDYALVAGVNLFHSPLRYLMSSKSRTLSTDGKCKTFDIDANGYVAGEGVGVILLQPLRQAIKDRNHIYGIIKGCAVNHGGKAISVSYPRVEAQKNVILDAYQEAEFSPDTVTYIEAHGTGTSLGDPIEIEALTKAFQQFTKAKQFCKIGSVKTNIGHLEGAAGIAGVIKVLLMLRYQKIPGILNIKTINPIIDFKNSPFAIADRLTQWNSREKNLPLRAGISSFGVGGVNSHVLIEEHIPQKEPIKNEEVHFYTNIPFLISAKNPASLEGILNEWRNFVCTDNFFKQPIKDTCLTMLTGRENFFLPIWRPNQE